METQTIFFTGKPGSGKGTQAKLLSDKTGWPIFASGDLFRAIAREDTPVGHKVKQENDAGLLQPHWFAMYLFLKTLFSVPSGANVIFDGFCRKVPEAELIIDSLRWLERPFTVLDIQVSDAEVEKRLALRKNEENRTDDNAVNKRLQEYHTYADPATELFRKAGVRIEINGEQTRGAIAADINIALNIK